MFHKSNLNKIIAGYTGQPLSKVEQDTDRDNYMNPIQAREYGIIDHVIGGDDLVFKVKGSIRKFPKVSQERTGTHARTF
jgi:ATP-dependent Clp protease protease subunit